VSNFLVAFVFLLLGAVLERVAKGLYLMWYRRRHRYLGSQGIDSRLIDRLNRDLAKRHASSSVRIPVSRESK
jgi:hypothetical protein